FSYLLMFEERTDDRIAIKREDFADLDDWPLNAQHRHLHFVAGRERNQVAGGCAIVAGVEAVSAVQQGSTGGITERARDSLRTFSRIGRKTKSEAGLAQYSVAQCFISRVRRLHGDRGIPERGLALSRSR